MVCTSCGWSRDLWRVLYRCTGTMSNVAEDEATAELSRVGDWATERGPGADVDPEATNGGRVAERGCEAMMAGGECERWCPVQVVVVPEDGPEEEPARVVALAATGDEGEVGDEACEDDD